MTVSSIDFSQRMLSECTLVMLSWNLENPHRKMSISIPSAKFHQDDDYLGEPFCIYLIRATVIDIKIVIRLIGQETCQGN